MSKFLAPKFDSRDLEVRVDANTVAIYGTKVGLKRLAELCLQLASASHSKPNDHIHIEDYELLTEASLPLDVACFYD